MKQAVLKSITLTIAWALFSSNCTALAQNVDASPAVHKTLTGQVSQSELNDSLERLGLNCSLTLGPPNILRVQKVRMGSTAFYGGVADGDRIIQLVEKQNGYELQIERDGHIYQLTLQSLDPNHHFQANAANNVLFTETALHDPRKMLLAKARNNSLIGSAQHTSLIRTTKQTSLIGATDKTSLVGLTKQTSLIGSTDKTSLISAIDRSLLHGNAQRQNIDLKPLVGTPELTGKTNDDHLKSGLYKTQDDDDRRKLKDVEVELIIDITGSMNEHDGTGELTKFQWCHAHILDLVEKLRQFVPTITITTFNEHFTTFNNCDAGKVEQVYAETTPQGWTDLVDPLNDRLSSYLTSWRPGRKPLLIAVLHDGLPNVPRDPNVVKKAIVDATNRMVDPDQITLTFLQIGDSFQGRDFLIDLDDNLVNEGAKYDIVDTKTFPQVKHEGLAKCLVDALTERKSLAKSGLDKSIRRVQREISRTSPGQVPTFDSPKLDSELQEKREQRYNLEKLIEGKK